MISKTKRLVSIALLFLLAGYSFGQQQNNTVVVQQNIAPVVIEKPVYIERYRTVYVDKPQPARTARTLTAPVQLLGYLWVHTEDLGNFSSQPFSVIASINAQNPYGRNDWRIPTPDELAVMENNADKIGLGDNMYMATDASNGVLRLVSTGKTVAEQQAEKDMYDAKLAAEQMLQEEVRRAEELRKAEEARLYVPKTYIYVAGSYMSGTTERACSWQNEKLTPLSGEQNADAIAIEGTRLYVAGYNWGGSGNDYIYCYVNGVKRTYPGNDQYICMEDMAVSNGRIYMTGYTNHDYSGGDSYKTWEDGVEVRVAEMPSPQITG